MISHIETFIARMESAVQPPGAAAVTLYGGPFDGCTSYVEASVLLGIIRADGALCLPLDEGGHRCAAYRLQSDGPIYRGLKGFFRGHAAYEPDPIDCGG